MSENRAIDEAKAALKRLSTELEQSIRRWERETGLRLASVDLTRHEVTSNAEAAKRERSYTLTEVRCRAEIEG